MFDNTLGDVGDLLLKLHKGSVASFNAKKTAQVLALFPGWTMTQMAMIKPSDEGRSFGNLIRYDNHSVLGRNCMLHATSNTYDPETGKSHTTIRIQSFDEEEATGLHTQVAKFAVTSLPDAKKAKSDDYFVINLTDPVETQGEDGHRARWVWTFDLYRKCKGYAITSPDGQRFDVCGPTQVLGYTGTQEFSHFFKWALANTDLEAKINATLGLKRHIPASERPRVPVANQTLGTCAICMHTQVVRGNKMVNHGYQRPGHGYIIGECFGVRHDAYEISANACIAYIPHLRAHETKNRTWLAQLENGEVGMLTRMVYDYKTGQKVSQQVKKDHKDFPTMLRNEIENTKSQIGYILTDIQIMNKRISNWKPGTLTVRNETDAD